MRNLGLSPLGLSRLNPGPLPRLFSDPAPGLVSGALSSPLTGLKIESPEMPFGKGLEIRPDLPGRALAEDKTGLFTPCINLPLGPVGNRPIALRSAEDETKEK